MATDNHPGRWGTVRYAIDQWGRTLRLCLIVLVMSVPPAVVAVLVRVLMRR